MVRPVIMDTDADFDDLIAIAWLLKRDEIDIKAIVYTGTGWMHTPYGIRNLNRFLNYIGYSDTTVNISVLVH